MALFLRRINWSAESVYCFDAQGGYLGLIGNGWIERVRADTWKNNLKFSLKPPVRSAPNISYVSWLTLEG